MFDQRSLDDYVDVAERITEFYDRYPEGCLRAADPGKPWELAIVTGTRKDGTETTQTFIVVVAAAYRMPGDLAPGMGMAWEVFPGRTPYTLGSELMNAETSAWGRAMAALGIATKRGVASRQEVAARRAERDDGLPVNRDGSLSRSRTTDEEKDGAGVMTSGQHAEHSALQPKRAEQPPAERLRSVPADDEWYAPPPDERDYDSPRTISWRRWRISSGKARRPGRERQDGDRGGADCRGARLDGGLPADHFERREAA